MKTLLVVPPNWTGDKTPLGQVNLSTMPLGLCYIAAVLEANGFSSRILDMNAFNLKIEKLENRLHQISPDVVGITAMTSTYPNAAKVAKTVKRWNPKSVVVVGGVHATFMHKEILENTPEIDVVVRYEGELTMLELVEALEKNSPLASVNGISFREKGKVVSTPFRPRIEDLDELAYPAYHLLEPSVEEYMDAYGTRNFPIITTRGCPFGCIYCSTMAFHGKKYRTRSIPNVIGELELLTGKFKANNVSFVDDNFTMQKDRVFKLCEEIKKKSLSFEWGCSARVDQVSEELLKAMKEAGCKDIFFGIESASQRVLDLVRKRFSVRQAKDAVKKAEKLGIRTHCSFVIGLPGESPCSLSNMVKFVEETKPSARVLPNLLEILPGTELFERKEEYFSGQPSVSCADMTKIQLEMLTAFYKSNFGVNELFRIAPPNITIE